MAYTHDDYLHDGMERALWADGEKLRQLTGEDHGPWVDNAIDVAAIDRLRILLRWPAADRVASTISLRQSATETKPAFVRRIVGAFLDEVTQ